MKLHAIILLLKSSLNSAQTRYRSRRLDMTQFILEISPNKRNIQSDIAKWEEKKCEIPGVKKTEWRVNFVRTTQHCEILLINIW